MSAMLTPEDVLNAAARLAGVVTETPMLYSRDLNRKFGVQAWFKAESFQRTNSFKFRGAYHHVSRLGPAERSRGVVGASSGNHAQALSLAGRLHEIPATVVVPEDCPETKIKRVLDHGAAIVRYRRGFDNRDGIVARIAQETGACIVPSSDDYDVMAGNGTVALEMLDSVPDLDTLLIPLGGGGLAAGCATVAKHLNPEIRIFGVEPAGASDTYQSFQANRSVTLTRTNTVADGLRHLTPSKRPLAVNRQLLDGVILVSDGQVVAAMRLAFENLKVVLEPSGACAMAALLSGDAALRASRRVGVVLSGANVDWDTYTDLTRPFDPIDSQRPEGSAHDALRATFRGVSR